MAISAAFFDVGNVLLRFSQKEVLRKFAWAVRRNPLRIARQLWRGRIIERIESGALSGEQIHKMFVEELGYEGSYARFRDLWCDHFTLDRGSYAILKRLSAQMPTYLLSNTNALHFDYIRESYYFPELVRGSILSHEVGLRKPDPAIYRKALELSGTKPGETLFVDDLEANCAGARKVGLVAIRYRGAEDLKKRLEALGL